MERLTEIKTHVTGFSYTDKKEGIFAQSVYAKLAAYEDTGLTPEQIEAMKEDVMRLKAMAYDCDDADDDFHPADFRNVHDIEIIEAQQQEIEQLKDQNDALSDTVNMFAPYIIGKKEAEVVEDLKELLTLKQQNAVLTADKDEQAGRIVRLENLLRRIRPILRTSDIYRHALAAIDALLGGKEDV